MVASTPGQPLGDGVGANLMAVRIYTSVVSVSAAVHVTETYTFFVYCSRLNRIVVIVSSAVHMSLHNCCLGKCNPIAMKAVIESLCASLRSSHCNNRWLIPQQ
jgi:hypothetical protein